MPQWSPALSAGNGALERLDCLAGGDRPQWSPALSAGNGSMIVLLSICAIQPQWSPALSAGNGVTLWRVAREILLCRNGAQPYRLGMVVGVGVGEAEWGVAMEPSLIGWEWRGSTPGRSRSVQAAMEPSLIGWEWRPTTARIDPFGTGRNGAQPYRLGMADGISSPISVFGGRNGAQPYRLGMEWSHGCRSSANRCRNGAQPYRLGMVCNTPCWVIRVFAAMEPSLIGWEWMPQSNRVPIRRCCRNGAQPYRLGMVEALPQQLQCFGAAMEPSLIGWEWRGPQRNAFPDGNSRNGAQPYRLGMGHATTPAPPPPSPPQWSPALSAGNGLRGGRNPNARVRAAMEPSLIGWEWWRWTPSTRSAKALPQWSPALSAGNGIRSSSSRSLSTGRNGAQPYRLGMAVERLGA